MWALEDVSFGRLIRDAILDETDNGLSVQEEWDLSKVLSDDVGCDKSHDDMDSAVCLHHT